MFDGVVRLTRVGATYVLFTIVIGFAALNTGNNALYIGLTFMLGCLLLSGIASKGGLKHLDVALHDAGEAWVGEPADATLTITNNSRIWNVRDVVVTTADLTEPLLIPLLVRQSRITTPAPFVWRVIASEAQQSRKAAPSWITSSRSLSSGRPLRAGPVGSAQ